MNSHFKQPSLHIALASAFVLVAAGFSAQSRAGSANTNLGVSASVSDNCSIVTTPVAFGTYDPFSGSANLNTGSVTLTCTNGASATVTLDQGLNPAGSSSDAVPLRQMLLAAGTDTLAYFLYQNAGRTTVWGNTGGTGVTQAGTGSAGTALTVYGKVPAGQNSVHHGSYADTVVATVSF